MYEVYLFNNYKWERWAIFIGGILQDILGRKGYDICPSTSKLSLKYIKLAHDTNNDDGNIASGYNLAFLILPFDYNQPSVKKRN